MTNNFKGVFALNAEGFLANPKQRALLALATKRDTYEVTRGRMGSGYVGWEHGRQVNGFNMGQVYPIAVGDILEIKSIATGQAVAYGEVETITMIEADAMTDEDLEELGFRDRAHYLERTEGGLGRKGWFIQLTLLDETTL